MPRPLAIDHHGAPRGYEGALTVDTRGALRATTGLHRRIGFNEPRLSYLGLSVSTPAGIRSSGSPPMDGRVEIAHFTFPGHEAQGFATAMASRLIAIAKNRRPTRFP